MSRIIFCVLGLSGLLLGDTLTLRGGRSVQGTYLGGDSRQIRMAVDDRIETFAVGDVRDIHFGATPAQPAAAPAAAAAAAGASAARPAVRAETTPRARVPIMRPERPVAGTSGASPGPTLEVPAGSEISIRMIDDVDSERDQVGQTFRASVDEPVMVDGKTLIPRGADVAVKLVEDKQSGRLSGRTELTLDLQSITLNGRNVDILTQEVTTASESRTARTGKVVGGTAALGAIIGAIAGGGKGAAVGAVTGAGAGAAVQVLTKGQRVRIPPETRLVFTLQQPVRI
ncbi:MAG: hypothetical protein HYS04_02490 [Acidobacteria bacterium]|nr:hypothetical protein [Acidobacteriota bacterium]